MLTSRAHEEAFIAQMEAVMALFCKNGECDGFLTVGGMTTGIPSPLRCMSSNDSPQHDGAYGQ